MTPDRPRRAFIGIGSNLGDRLENLQLALTYFKRQGAHVVEVSNVYDTKPVGGPAQPNYLNAVFEVLWRDGANDLLALAQAAEVNAHRVRGEKWGPRTLDVDIVAVDGISLAAADDPTRLALPHPLAHTRAFVLEPLAELAPTFELEPGKTVAELLAALPEQARADVERTSLTLTI